MPAEAGIQEGGYKIFEGVARRQFIWYDVYIHHGGYKMQRTQIYLDPAQKRDLSQISRKRRATVSELIRQAIEQFLQKSPSGFEEAVEKTFGLWSKRKDIGNASVYVRKIRREWEKRGKRIWK